MSSFSKQLKRHAPAEPLLILTVIAAIVILVVSGADNGALRNSIRSVLMAPNSSGAHTVVSADDITFASDEQYWSANCSHGWKSDSTCDDILVRTQICAAGTGLAYCSAYETYMQQFQRQPEMPPIHLLSI